jgi:hypothetical protein
MAWIQDTYSKTLGHGGLDAIGMQQTFFEFFPFSFFALEIVISSLGNRNRKTLTFCRSGTGP